MKSNTTLYLIIGLIFSTVNLTSVFAVTDAELEALEKQLKQQESEEVKQAEAKRRAELENQRLREVQKRLDEDKRQLVEERRKLEEARLAELERKRQEVEARKKAEVKKNEKYNFLIREAEHAIGNKDKELAISKYNEALALVPEDGVAISGLKKARKLKDKFCYQLIGTWKESITNDITKFYENGTVTFKSSIVSYEHSWECRPERREISMNYLNNNNPIYISSFKLSDDNKKLHFVKRGSLYAEKISDGYIK